MNLMKLQITALKWICIFLSVPFLTNGQGNSANSLCNLHEPNLSAVFLEKAVFEAQTQNEKNIALLEKAYCYKENGSYKRAAETLERAFPSSSNDSTKFLIGYELALCHYLDDQYTKSLLFLIQLKNTVQDEKLLEKVTYLEVLLAHENQNWEKANGLVMEMKFIDPVFADSINTLYSNLNNLKLKDPEKAESISYFIPGSGQMYAGKVFRGVSSLVIQSGLLVFAGYSFLNGYYFSGTFTGVSLFYVFYMGGARHARYLAEEYNRQEIAKKRNKVENYLFEEIKKEARK
jgi:tetratricopeptide (TPR) repeat protein